MVKLPTLHKVLRVIEKKSKMRLATFNKGRWTAHTFAVWREGGREGEREGGREGERERGRAVSGEKRIPRRNQWCVVE